MKITTSINWAMLGVIVAILGIIFAPFWESVVDSLLRNDQDWLFKEIDYHEELDFRRPI